MTREDKRINTKKIAERRVRRDHADKILEFVATNKIKPVLLNMNTTLRGLSEEEVLESRSSYGRLSLSVPWCSFPERCGLYRNPVQGVQRKNYWR